MVDKIKVTSKEDTPKKSTKSDSTTATSGSHNDANRKNANASKSVTGVSSSGTKAGPSGLNNSVGGRGASGSNTVEAKNAVVEVMNEKPQAIDKNQLPKPLLEAIERMDRGTALMMKFIQEQADKQAQSGNLL